MRRCELRHLRKPRRAALGQQTGEQFRLVVMGDRPEVIMPRIEPQPFLHRHIRGTSRQEYQYMRSAGTESARMKRRACSISSLRQVE